MEGRDLIRIKQYGADGGLLGERINGSPFIPVGNVPWTMYVDHPAQLGIQPGGRVEISGVFNEPPEARPSLAQWKGKPLQDYTHHELVEICSRLQFELSEVKLAIQRADQIKTPFMYKHPELY